MGKEPDVSFTLHNQPLGYQRPRDKDHKKETQAEGLPKLALDESDLRVVAFELDIEG